MCIFPSQLRRLAQDRKQFVIRKDVMFPNLRFSQNPHSRQLRQVSARGRVVHIQFAGKFGGRDDGKGKYGFDQVAAINLFIL